MGGYSFLFLPRQVKNGSLPPSDTGTIIILLIIKKFQTAISGWHWLLNSLRKADWN